MPVGEKELHPYLEQGSLNGATKLILGSFPIYECTDPYDQLKHQRRLNKGTVRFFYGSNRNNFWTKYSLYIDKTIAQPWDPELILDSLRKRQIAISDTIISCERRNFSSSDNHLSNKEYNRQGIQSLLQNGVKKIICTSKGVLSDLENKIILYGNNPFGKLDNLAGCIFQDKFIEGLGGNNGLITNPISKVFIIGGHQITALAIPSPGSPQRQAHQFGCESQYTLKYTDGYFRNAFEWLIE